ncbi:hypothetical protein [Yoonia sp. 1_MG-2023]|nr:hypothetical protein [Yoonia sp. 1_MG-2023]
MLIAPVLLLPWRWVWAWLNFITLGYGAFIIATPPLLGRNSNFADIVVAFLLLSAAVMLGAVFLGRFFFHAHRQRNMTLRLDHPATYILHIANGVVIGCIAGFIGASITAGTNAYIIHAVLILLSALPLAFLRLRGLSKFYFCGMATGCAALAFFNATYPKQVYSSAHAAAGDAPFCIYLNQSKRFAESPQDLTFFTLDKGDWSAHAVLVIGSGDATRYGNWSYYQNQFMVPWYLGELPTHLQCPTDH